MKRFALAIFAPIALVVLPWQIVGLDLGTANVQACPFCNAVSQTLRQEMAAMDAVVIAEAAPIGKAEQVGKAEKVGKTEQEDAYQDNESGNVLMKVTHVLKGGELISVDEVVTATYYGEVTVGRRFMLSGVDPPELLWSCLPLTAKAEAYVKKIPTLGEDGVERLKFYYEFLQDEDSMLSRDAYDEFAIAPYDVIQEMGSHIKKDQLIGWLNEPELPTDRKRLYLTLLGIVGDETQLPMLEERLRSTQKSTRGGLDALIACYLTLGGEKGLPLIEELFLSNKKSSYADTYAAIMAIRFHGTEGDVIARSALMESLHPVLDRPDLADLVIPDLARWKDWSLIDRMVRLFTESDPENNWVRVPVVNYLRACPLPAADEAIAKLTEIDPESVRRANTFFSIPVPARDVKADESSIRGRSIPERGSPGVSPAADDIPATFPAAIDNDPHLVMPKLMVPVADNTPKRRIGVADRPPLAAMPVSGPVNRTRLVVVLAMMLTTLGVGQFLLLSGGGIPLRTTPADRSFRPISRHVHHDFHTDVDGRLG